jgi:short-subunit dehydrogenase
MTTRKLNIVLITGASTGIGKVASLYLVEKGYKVIGTSRSLEKLSPVVAEANGSEGTFVPVELDINLPSGAPGCIEEVLPRLADEHGTIDVLVNNAGYALWGPLEGMTPQQMVDQFTTNVFAPFRLSNTVIPAMRQQAAGRIINISSVAGWVVTPFNGAYASSKFALEAQSQALRMELSPFGVKVSLIEPGLFDSEFQNNTVDGERAESPELPYGPHIAAYRRKHGRFRVLTHDPIRIARLIDRIITTRNPKLSYPIGLEAHIGILASKLLPGWLFERMVAKTSM